MDAALSYDFLTISRKKIPFLTVAAKAKVDKKESFAM